MWSIQTILNTNHMSWLKSHMFIDELPLCTFILNKIFSHLFDPTLIENMKNYFSINQLYVVIIISMFGIAVKPFQRIRDHRQSSIL